MEFWYDERVIEDRDRQTRTGFTLLEVILAVALLSAAVLVLYFTWSTGLQGWKYGAEAAEDIQRTRAILDGMGELLRSTVFYDQSEEDEENEYLYEFRGIEGTYGENAADSISFVTYSSRFLRPYEADRIPLRRVEIALEQDEDRQPYLAMYNLDALSIEEKKPSPHRLSDEIVGFNVRYYDDDLEDWYDEWVDEVGLPGQVEITMTYREREGEEMPLVQQLVIPLVVREAAEQELSGAQKKQQERQRRQQQRPRPARSAPAK